MKRIAKRADDKLRNLNSMANFEESEGSFEVLEGSPSQ